MNTATVASSAFFVIAAVVAFLVGFAMKRGGLCVYAAARQMVRQRRADLLLAFLAATAIAALFIVPLAWWQGDPMLLGSTHRQLGMALAGGVLLGLGAWLNRGCVFGTFVQLTGGNTTYLFTLAGMAGGAVVARWWLADVAPLALLVPPAAVGGTAVLAWLGLAVLLMLLHAILLRRRQAGAMWGALVLALILGAGGGWLFSHIRGWDFASVLTSWANVSAGLTSAGPANIAVITTLAMVVGGVVAAVAGGQFTLKWPSMAGLLASLIGGALMGMAAFITPGGNDGMLLSGIPALAPHALAGFAAMLVVMLMLLRLLPNDGGYSINKDGQLAESRSSRKARRERRSRQARRFWAGWRSR